MKRLQVKYSEKIESKIREYLHLVDGYPQLSIPLIDFLERGGKRFRPIMCLLSCELIGGDSDSVLPIAASIEMFHNFSLIHDDIEDRGDFRRNKLALHLPPKGDALAEISHCPYCDKVIKTPEEAESILNSVGVKKNDLPEPYGLSHAINSGDALLLLSSIAANEIYSADRDAKETQKAVDEIFFGVLNVCMGQSRDIDSYEKRFSKEELTEGDVLETLRLKTGMLISAGCKAGAIMGGGTKEEIESLGKFCEDISLAFQLQDDILNIDVRGTEYGKEIGGDIEEGKRTLIVAHALETLEDERERLLDILDRRNNTEEEKMEAIGILRDCGAIDYVREYADMILDRAKESLKIFPDSQARRDLLELSDFLVKRGY
ncbi:MAG: polyprenyl synthetase family protein, partial [Halobacteriota archaeon]|nr:polyprenyl synthetase family protein [Halobacteriota archaeon]